MRKLTLFLLLLFASVASAQITVVRAPTTGGTYTFTNNLSAIGWQRVGGKVYLFDASEPVGIGIAAPVGNLHVFHSGTLQPLITFENASADAFSSILDFTKDSAGPDDGDNLGLIRFIGDDSGLAATTFAQILAEADDVTDGVEAGKVTIELSMNGTLRDFIILDAYNGTPDEGEIILNEDSQDIDYRFESDTDANAFTLLGSSGFVGLGTAAPGGKLHIVDSGGNAPELRLESTTAGGSAANLNFYQKSATPADGDWSGLMSFYSYDSTESNFDQTFLMLVKQEDMTTADGAGSVDFDVLMDNTGRSFLFFDGFNGTVNQGQIIFNEDSQDIDYRIESDNDANAFFIQGSDGHAGFGTGAPTNDIHAVSSTSLRPVLEIENTHIDEFGPSLLFNKNSGSPAANDVLAYVYFAGDDAGGNAENYSTITSLSERVVEGEESGSMDFTNLMSGTDRSFLKLDAYNGTDNDGEIIFNEASQDIDIRMESDNDVNAFVLQSSDGFIGFGTATPAYDLEIVSATSNRPYLNLKNTNADALGPILGFESTTAGPAAGDEVGHTRYLHDTDVYATVIVYADDISAGDEAGTYEVKILIDNALKSAIQIEGNTGGVGQAELVINEDSADLNFRVESDASTSGLIFDAGTGDFGVGVAPTEAIDISTEATSQARVLRFRAGNATPTSSASTSAADIYFKDSTLVIRYDDGGTVRYKSLVLTGTGVTWVHATSAP